MHATFRGIEQSKKIKLNTDQEAHPMTEILLLKKQYIGIHILCSHSLIISSAHLLLKC